MRIPALTCLYQETTLQRSALNIFNGLREYGHFSQVQQETAALGEDRRAEVATVALSALAGEHLDIVESGGMYR